MTARGPKCCRGLPEHPRGWCGWLKRKGPRAPPSGQQGPRRAERPAGPTAWSAAGGSHAVETRTEERGQFTLLPLRPMSACAPPSAEAFWRAQRTRDCAAPHHRFSVRTRLHPHRLLAVCQAPAVCRQALGASQENRGFASLRDTAPRPARPPSCQRHPGLSPGGRHTLLLPQPAWLPSGTPQHWNREATGALALREGLSPDRMTRLSGAEPRPVHL